MTPKYYSQFRQDEFLNEVILNHKKGGFFIDIGAHDGVTISNSLYFEKFLHWEGICIEPNPEVFRKLQANRRSNNLNVCIGNDNKTVKFTQITGYSEMLSGISDAYDERHRKRFEDEVAKKGGTITEIDVPMITLESIENLKGKTIDFISIDTEGNEFDIVQGIDFNQMNVKALIIENNYNDTRIKDYLARFRYELLYRLDCDEVFVHQSAKSLSIQWRLLKWKTELLLKKIKSKLGL